MERLNSGVTRVAFTPFLSFLEMVIWSMRENDMISRQETVCLFRQDLGSIIYMERVRY